MSGRNRRVLIMAGGTGGHVFPALAVAQVLAERGADVHWLGSVRGMENDWVPQAGFPLQRIPVTGLRGKGVTALLAAPWRLTRAVWAALQVLRVLDPAVVLGFGGFASGPGGLAAWLLRKPLLVHEQNAIAGTTNRILAKLAKQVLTGFSGVFAQGVWVGNPVRPEITKLPEPAQRYPNRSDAPRLLVLGGSQGARALNEGVPTAVAALPETNRPQIWHQAGKREAAATEQRYQQLAVEARVDAFIEDMAAAYDWADLVICRAGALTVSELAAAGVASVLVPLPHAIDDHQTANARWLADQAAAHLLPQTDMAQALPALLQTLLADRATLQSMAQRARNLARPNAAADVADRCGEWMHG